MKFSLFSLTVLLISIAFQSCSGNAEIYVSPTGNDSNNGSIKQPFATIQHAVDFIKKNNHNNSVIILREGIYEIKESLVLDSLPDNLVIKAYQNESVHITGGRKIKGFKPIDKKTPGYERLNKDVRSLILQVNLKTLGITNYGEIKHRGFGSPIAPSGLMLYFNGEPMTIARWPNDSWARTKEIPEKLNGKGFSYSGNRPSRWKEATDIWMHGYWKWDWADSYVKIDKINRKKKEITISDPQSPYPYAKKRRFYFFNVLEELDSPGEWYLNRETGMLYFYPPGEIGNAEMYVSLLSKPLMKIKNCNGVTISNLNFEYSNGTGVVINGGKNNLIQNCLFRNFSTVAVCIGNTDAGSKIYGNTLYNGNAGTNNGISNCIISNTGEGGIILGGGDRKTLTPGKNFVENTKIYKVSEWVRTYRAGIYMYGVGNIVRNNEIYNLPHTAIFFWGNDHLVEYNNIHHVCMETADAGAIYNGRDWTQRGHLIQYNYIHHLHGVETTGSFNDVMGVYLDDYSSGTTVYSNIFYKAGRNILVGGGRDNTIKNNIFIDGYPAVHVDARGIGWGKYYFKHPEENILIQRYKAVNAGNPPYSEKYPELLTVLDDEPAIPKNNCIETNVFCGGRWRDLRNNMNDSIICFKNNTVKESGDFYSIENNNIKIDFSSDIFPDGFKEIPIEEIGVK